MYILCGLFQSVVWLRAEVFISSEVQFINVFIDYAFIIVPKSHCHDQDHLNFLYVIFWEVYGFIFYI
jgi:hypothetical protein